MFEWQTAEGSSTASRSLNTCIHIYRVERGERRDNTINRNEYVQCSLGKDRALQNETLAAGEQKDGRLYHISELMPTRSCGVEV